MSSCTNHYWHGYYNIKKGNNHGRTKHNALIHSIEFVKVKEYFMVQRSKELQKLQMRLQAKTMSQP